jgi:parallel beta-helix repeat protein
VTGIKVNSGFNVISENNCSNNDYGIKLTAAGYSSLSGNICQYNGNVGLYLYQSSANNLEGNICENNGHGIYLLYSGANSLLDNGCKSNNLNGISLYSSNGNTLSRNDCSLNNYGLSLTNYSDQNTIFMNTFVDNVSANVQSSGYGIYVNVWRSPGKMNYSYNGSVFNGYLGNHYGDHNLLDTDGDGITDAPYDLPGDEPDDAFALVTTDDLYIVE